METMQNKRRKKQQHTNINNNPPLLKWSIHGLSCNATGNLFLPSFTNLGQTTIQ